MGVADRASSGLLIAVTLLVFILLYGPLMVPIILSFFTISRGAVDWSQPTTSAYAALLLNESFDVSCLNVRLWCSCLCKCHGNVPLC